ncbi:MAG: hypothetical protein II842_19790 [Butyrivibrio sp.]|nr:hypothetical protein [Butyrivibrio sp.]
MQTKWIKRGKFALLIAALIISYFAMDRLLSIKTAHGICQARDMYAQPADTVDVVFLGSSHIHCDVNTALLWRDYGIAAYDYSAAEQPLWITYYYLQEICRYQKPKLVVLDLYGPARFKDDYQYTWLTENLNGFRFSINKMNMLRASCEPAKFFEYFPSLVTYHMRYTEVSKEDWEYLFSSKNDRAAFKGFTPYFKKTPQIEPTLGDDHQGGLTNKSRDYLNKIIQYCDDNGIDLFLTVTPYITTYQDELVYNQVHDIANSYGIKFDSTNYSYSIMDIDFENDFYDESHLNYYGSCKFTKYIADSIKNAYDIPDRRGQLEWESWDRNVGWINKEVTDAGWEIR